MKILLIFFMSLIFSSCTYPAEDLNNVKKKIVVDKNNVFNCIDDNIEIDFCNSSSISIYNKNIELKPNFNKTMNFIILNKTRESEIGESKKINFMVVYDRGLDKIIPFPQIVGNFVDDQLRVIEDDPAVIKFSVNSSRVCISGTTYSKSDNNINVEDECYIYSDKGFKKENNNKVVELSHSPSILDENKEYSSLNHFECLLRNKCLDIELISSFDLRKKYDFISPNDGGSVVLKRGDKKIIIAPFEDESGKNVRLMVVQNNKLIDERFLYAGKEVKISKANLLTYYEGNKKIEITLIK